MSRIVRSLDTLDSPLLLAPQNMVINTDAERNWRVWPGIYHPKELKPQSQDNVSNYNCCCFHSKSGEMPCKNLYDIYVLKICCIRSTQESPSMLFSIIQINNNCANKHTNNKISLLR